MKWINMGSLVRLSCFIGLALTSIASGFAQEESIILDPSTGNYLVKYKSVTDGNLIEVSFVPATKVDPILKSKFKLTDHETVLYEYKVRNGRQGRQPLIGLRLVVSRITESSQIMPKDWEGNAIPETGDAGVRVNWTYGELPGDGSTGLSPGRSQSGFGVESLDLPGIGEARLNGNTPIQGFPDEGPNFQSAVGKQFDELKAHDFVSRPAAIPQIPVPDPFDAAAVLTSLQAHIKNDWVAMKLVDPAFAAKLDEGFAAAIEAAKRGNTDGLRRELKALRHLRKGFGEAKEDKHTAGKREDDDSPDDKFNTKSWPHPIAKLAARVLDFDLKYIKKHVKGRLE